MKIQEVVSILNQWAPSAYQESYDNATLITGSASAEITGVLITLDCTEEIVEEATEKGCNLIVAHHPIVFQGLKSLTGKTYVERTVIKAIKKDIAIYAVHTNLDNVHTGVNKKICDRIGLKEYKILAPKAETLTKLVTFVPSEKSEQILTALFSAGAGQIGNYDDCSYLLDGTGTFRPNDEADPYIGKAGELQREAEQRIEVILPTHIQKKVITALKKAHPYEEVAYYLSSLKNENQEVGSGMIGSLASSLSGNEFLELLKVQFDLNVIKHTEILGKQINRVAVCGGAGSFLLKKAIASGADAFVSSDFKYHEYFDAENKILIADIGHYESEVFTKELIYEFLNEKIANIAVNLSERVTNPIKYFK